MANKKQRPKQTLAKQRLPSLANVCQSPDRFLGRLDIAALNLMCAGGLPHAGFDIPRMLDWLDEAARQAEFETRRHWYRFLDSPQTYHGSAGYFCCYFLLQTLQEDFGVRYNPARVKAPKFQDPKCIDPDFTDSRDLFIHGIIDGPGGTCASMPVLYVAVGRRLGYPLKLVEARGHLYFSWDGPHPPGRNAGLMEHFNVEGTGHGIGSYPDAYYESWPQPPSPLDRAAGVGTSLTPAREVAAFLTTRAECLVDNHRIPDAIQAYRWAVGLAPNDPRYQGRLGQLDGSRAAIMNLFMRPYEEARRRWILEQQQKGGATWWLDAAPPTQSLDCGGGFSSAGPAEMPSKLPSALAFPPHLHPHGTLPTLHLQVPSSFPSCHSRSQFPRLPGG